MTPIDPTTIVNEGENFIHAQHSPETIEEITAKFSPPEPLPDIWTHALVRFHVKYRKETLTSITTAMQQVVNDRVRNVIILEGDQALLALAPTVKDSLTVQPEPSMPQIANPALVNSVPFEQVIEPAIEGEGV